MNRKGLLLMSSNHNKKLQMLIKVIEDCKTHIELKTPNRVWSTYFRYALNEFEKDVNLISKSLIDDPEQKVIYEHAIPFRIVRDKLIQLDEITKQSVSAILEKYHVVAKISEKEDRLLKEAGLDSKMPDNWDEKNMFARYESVGIEIVNPTT